MRPLLFLLAVACDNKGDPDTVDSVEDTAAEVGDDDVVDTQLPKDDSALYGTYPDTPVDAPDFAATNYDGGARSREDLLGQPTVMWFFPAAGSFG
ncbi:MAG: hypothetical protein ACI8S6_003225 [Myxococcota bacterium]|jgi:hypothetical protein